MNKQHQKPGGLTHKGLFLIHASPPQVQVILQGNHPPCGDSVTWAPSTFGPAIFTQGLLRDHCTREREHCKSHTINSMLQSRSDTCHFHSQPASGQSWSCGWNCWVQRSILLLIPLGVSECWNSRPQRASPVTRGAGSAQLPNPQKQGKVGR